jgi:hypothetical protein
MVERVPFDYKKFRKIGMYSKPSVLARVDGRTKEAVLMARVRDGLTAHVGGDPTFTQQILIHQAAVLALRVAQIECQLMAGEVLTQHDNTHAIAWANCLRRTAAALGIEPASAKPPDPLDAIRALAARHNQPQAAD